MKKHRVLWMFSILILFLSGCQQQSQETHYKEIVTQEPQEASVAMPAAPSPSDQTTPSGQSMLFNPHAGLDMSSMNLPSEGSSLSQMFTWTLPQGWKQEPAGGMRLASFHLENDPKAIDGSMVALGGMAGGLEANLRRWMGQIGTKASDEELKNVISSAASIKIKSGQMAKIFDFTLIQSQTNLNEKSMVVVMVDLNEMTLFVKMTGPSDAVKKNKNDFLKLAASIEYHPSSNNVPMANNPVNTVRDPHAGLDMAAMAGLIDMPTSQNVLSWTAPQAWKEEPGRHMRMATFHAAGDPQAIDCSIIALGGPAGGLEANLQRWLGQAGLPASDDNVKQLIVSSQDLKTQGGLDVKVFDFTVLQPQANLLDSTMMVATLPVDQTTVFIKMTGSIKPVRENKDNFLKLIGSIRRK